MGFSPERVCGELEAMDRYDAAYFTSREIAFVFIFNRELNLFPYGLSGFLGARILFPRWAFRSRFLSGRAQSPRGSSKRILCESA